MPSLTPTALASVYSTLATSISAQPIDRRELFFSILCLQLANLCPSEAEALAAIEQASRLAAK